MRFRPPRPLRRAPQRAANPVEERVSSLVALSYELLDAHADTARLASDDAPNAEWDSHLAYLRDLQRVGREALALAAQPAGR
jgi:hypothetical protein